MLIECKKKKKTACTSSLPAERSVGELEYTVASMEGKKPKGNN